MVGVGQAVVVADVAARDEDPAVREQAMAGAEHPVRIARATESRRWPGSHTYGTPYLPQLSTLPLGSRLT